MWQGVRHGLHYLDHVKLLNTKMMGITGGAYTQYQVKSEKHWSLSLQVEVTGDMQAAGDGVLISLSYQPLPTYGPSFNDENFSMQEPTFTEAISKVF